MKQLVAATVALLAVGMLTSCAVSAEEQADCEQQGGLITSEKYTFQGKPGNFWSTNTGYIHACTHDDRMVEIYNNQITKVDGWIGGGNNDVFGGCEILGGQTFLTSTRINNITYTRYACVLEGQYHQILN